MKHLYFVRHGESFININNVFATREGAVNDLELTDNGKAHALASAQQAKDENLKFDAIVTSPLLRTRQTADIIAKVLGFPTRAIQISPLLIEVQYGELEGTPWDAFWNAGYTYADLGKFKGAETIEEMQKRAVLAVKFLSALPEDTILVVSHSGFGRAIYRAIKNVPYTDEFTNNISLPHDKILRLI